MHGLFRNLLLATTLFTVSGCTSGSANSAGADTSVGADSEATEPAVANAPAAQPAADLVISSEPCFAELPLDTDGDAHHGVRSLLNRLSTVSITYHRVGCSDDGCRDEITTYAAVQYPTDSVLQVWMADHLAHFYYDATQQADVLVNGERSNYTAEGEKTTLNTGCNAYDGILGDGGKQLFAYYQTRMWTIGRHREDDAHGPQGRYGCVIYRCWESPALASYLVAYSAGNESLPVHCVTTFDRHTAQPLELTDLIREDGLADFYDLLAEAARQRHASLLSDNPIRLAIDREECDYSSSLDVKGIGLNAEGLVVAVGALAFDQWPKATHLLTIPYAEAALVLKDGVRR